MPGPADTYVAYGLPWANASNTPFRRYKHWVHEGGISSPLIVHWPVGIDANQHNKFHHDPAHLIDFMATCVDVGEATYPTEAEGLAITPLQGTSLRPAFSGLPLERQQPIFWEHEGNRAIRDGRWKLVARGHDGPWELYDMDADRTELHDLVSTHSARATDMARQWEAWAVEANVKPWPWDRK
jgi:arylsulfatase